MSKESSIQKLTDREKFCLTAYLQLQDAELAYLCSRSGITKANDRSLAVQVSRWLNSEPVQAFIAVEQARKFTILNADNTENRSKDDVIKELNTLATQATDPKLKAEILLKLADLQQMKKQDDEDKESKIHYFAPLKCSQCPIKKAAAEKLKRK